MPLTPTVFPRRIRVGDHVHHAHQLNLSDEMSLTFRAPPIGKDDLGAARYSNLPGGERSRDFVSNVIFQPDCCLEVGAVTDDAQDGVGLLAQFDEDGV